MRNIPLFYASTILVQQEQPSHIIILSGCWKKGKHLILLVSGA
ncbi:MAG TPA: hypothetical protein VGL94_09085 [Ktedonobacteraceae bacterium]